MDGSHAHARSRPRLSEATHVPPANRAESRWSLFIYFRSFLVLKIYARTFATLLRLFTQANISAEKMILVMKGLEFSHYSTVVQVCARGQLSDESATYDVPLQVPQRGRGFGCYCSVFLMFSKGQYASASVGVITSV